MKRAVPQRLDAARRLAMDGQADAAKQAYLDLLRDDPREFSALNELAALACASGHRTAARTAWSQAVSFHPRNPMGRVNLGNLLYQDGAFADARAQFEAVLAVDPEFAEAHQGLARVLAELGEEAAAASHRQRGFTGHAIAKPAIPKSAQAVQILLLVSVKGGNIPTRPFLDDRFAVTALHAEYHDPAQPLPPHDLVFNAIGDADLCGPALAHAAQVVRRTAAPVINPPARVRATGRAATARRLAGLADVVVPAIRVLPRSALADLEDRAFPLLLRAPGFHTGRHFVRVEHPDDLPAAIAPLPGDPLLAIVYLDARGADGLARKYRVMLIDGEIYPLHLAISPDWKVHYFTAAMAENAAHRDEEKNFLENMEGVLGPRAMAALARIGRRLGLDYAGIDFGLDPTGSVLLFEANATMVINPPGPEPIWDYRRAAIARALAAVQHMLLARRDCRVAS